MRKIWLFVALLFTYLGYSFLVYTRGTEGSVKINEEARSGRSLYQEYNCAACHQIYGLGGYLGPELTTVWSDPARGEGYIRAFLQVGGLRMPNFHFSRKEIDALIEYLKHIDLTAEKAKPRME